MISKTLSQNRSRYLVILFLTMTMLSPAALSSAEARTSSDVMSNRADVPLSSEHSLSSSFNYDIELNEPSSTREGTTGTHHYSVDILNYLSQEVTVDISVTSYNSDWKASPDVTEVTVPGYNTTEVSIQVDIPKTVSDKDSTTINVTVTGKEDPTITASCEFTIRFSSPDIHIHGLSYDKTIYTDSTNIEGSIYRLYGIKYDYCAYIDGVIKKEGYIDEYSDYSFRVSDLTEGGHTLKMEVYDVHGVRLSTRSVNFTVDLTAPSVEITDIYRNENKYWTIKWKISDELTNSTQIGYQVYLDGRKLLRTGYYGTRSSDLTDLKVEKATEDVKKVSLTILYQLPEGEHSVKVKAYQDGGGNQTSETTFDVGPARRGDLTVPAFALSLIALGISMIVAILYFKNMNGRDDVHDSPDHETSSSKDEKRSDHGGRKDSEGS